MCRLIVFYKFVIIHSFLNSIKFQDGNSYRQKTKILLYRKHVTYEGYICALARAIARAGGGGTQLNAGDYGLE